MTSILKNSQLTVAVAAKGAELQSLRNAAGREFLWQGYPAYWGRRAPVLFPIVGRLKDSRYLWQGREYHLPQHGFARDRDFVLVAAGNDFARYRLAADAASREIYPFEFALEIGYRLVQNEVEVSWQVTNPATHDLLFSIGAHPGFNCPLLPGESWEDYALHFDCPGPLPLRLLQQGLLTAPERPLELRDQSLPLDQPGLFDHDALVFVGPPFDRVAIRHRRTGQGVALEAKGFPYYGIWSKPGGAPFVCLEPWHGVTDPVNATGRLEDKPGIMRVAPGKEFRASYKILILA
jgi:galactose mutarotase-like enzyme